MVLSIKSQPKIQPNIIPGFQGWPLVPNSSQLPRPFLSRKSWACANSPRRSKEAALGQDLKAQCSPLPWTQLRTGGFWILISDLALTDTQGKIHSTIAKQNQERSSKSKLERVSEQLCMRSWAVSLGTSDPGWSTGPLFPESHLYWPPS